MSSNLKEAALSLNSLAKQKQIRFPKNWDELKIRQQCASIISTCKKDDKYDESEAIKVLMERYGFIESKEDDKVNTGDEDDKKRKIKIDKIDNENIEDSTATDKSKKIKKTDTLANEQNRAIAEAIKEMADIYFKNKDMRKGGVFSKAAKAIRECETPITNKKEAMALKGVGKGIADYVMELLENGSIEKLEALRAGTA